MSLHNGDLAKALDQTADLLEISGENPFRIRAYRNASRIIGDNEQSFKTLVDGDADLTKIQGIGKDLALKIVDFFKMGRFEQLEELKAKFPEGIFDVLGVQGLGPKRVKALYQELGIGSLEDLKKAAEKGAIKTLSGFGAKIEKQILETIDLRMEARGRFRRSSVRPIAEELVAYLKEQAGIQQIELAGSFRRAKETHGDLDILAVADEPEPIMVHFVAFPGVKKILAQGKTKSSVVLSNNLQVDLRVVEAGSFGAAMHYFTGSQAHNIALRRRAQQEDLKLNEYGLFKGDEQVAGASEEEVFQTLGLAYIEPELREDRGEIEAAEEKALPALIEEKQIRGDLHNHSTASDGKNTIREMADAAMARGYEYVAITDHSKRLTIANGLNEERLLAQIDEIDEINEDYGDFRILKGIEVDILEDGALDLDDDVLSRLDVVVASVHSLFNLSGEKQTARIMKAIDSPYVTMIGHPTGRLLLAREAYDLDVPKIIEHARDQGCFVELNANPVRLDLNEVYCKLARSMGVLVCINTDAHRAEDFDLMRYGIGQARRGWLEEGDVLNTRSLKDLLPLLQQRKRGT